MEITDASLSHGIQSRAQGVMTSFDMDSARVEVRSAHHERWWSLLIEVFISGESLEALSSSSDTGGTL